MVTRVSAGFVNEAKDVVLISLRDVRLASYGQHPEFVQVGIDREAARALRDLLDGLLDEGSACALPDEGGGLSVADAPGSA